MSWIEVIRILVRNEIRTYLNKSNKIFRLDVNEKFFLVFKFIKTLLFVALSILFLRFYNYYKYVNEIRYIYIFVLGLFMIVICFGVKKKVFSPTNIEIFQLSTIKMKNIYKLFFLKESLWNFIKYLDSLIPIIVIGKIIFGVKNGVILDVFIISVSIMVFFLYCIIKNKQTNKKIKMDIKYFFMVPLIFFITKKIMNAVLEISLFLRNNLDVNSDEKINEVGMFLKKYIILNGKGLGKNIKNISQLIFLNQNFLIGISLISIFILIIILKNWYINYSQKDIKNTTILNNGLKNKYLKLIDEYFIKDERYCILKKDINIIKNDNTYINKNILQMILVPYEMYITSIIFYTICNSIENKYVFMNCIITYLITMLMTIFSNVKSNLNDLFTFKTDVGNWDLFRCSEYTSKDVFNAKLKLLRVLALIPSIITIVIALLFIGIKEILWYEKIGFVIVMLIIWGIMKYILPIMEIYAYPIFIKKFGDRYIEMFEEDEMDISKKFIMLPKNLIIRPMLLLLTLSGIVRIFNNNMWKIITILYIVWIGICVILCKKRYKKIEW